MSNNNKGTAEGRYFSIWQPGDMDGRLSRGMMKANGIYVPNTAGGLLGNITRSYDVVRAMCPFETDGTFPTGVVCLGGWDLPLYLAGSAGQQQLYFGLNAVGSPGALTRGQKQWAVVGGKVVIWPDRKMFDLYTLALSALPDTVPQMDLILSAGNRLWGCRSSSGTVYASKVGDPTDFDTSADLAWCRAVSSPGDFTAMCEMSNVVYVWKEHSLLRVSGWSQPRLGNDKVTGFTLGEIQIPGVRAGGRRSVAVMGSKIYYMGDTNVYAFNGVSLDTLWDVCNAGWQATTPTVFGTDGKYLYLSGVGEDGAALNLLYDHVLNKCFVQDRVSVAGYALCGDTFYRLRATGVVEERGMNPLLDEDDTDVPARWVSQTLTTGETVTLSDYERHKSGPSAPDLTPYMLWVEAVVPPGCSVLPTVTGTYMDAGDNIATFTKTYTGIEQDVDETHTKAGTFYRRLEGVPPLSHVRCQLQTYGPVSIGRVMLGWK